MPSGRWTVAWLAVLAVLVPVCPPQAEVSLGGYYEHGLQIDYREETNEVILDASKLRLDLVANAAHSWTFRGNVNFIHRHAAVDYPIVLLLPRKTAEELRLRGVPEKIHLERSRVFLDNAFLTWERGGWRLRAGKQQLSWGPGYSYNPTDLFHTKDPIDPTYEKEGVTALRLDHRWGIGGQASLILTPRENWRDTGKALRLATHLRLLNSDIALTAHDVTDTTGVDPAAFIPRKQRRSALGLELSGSLLGLGIWLEGQRSWMESEDDFTQLIVGTDYTLSSGLHIMLEGYWNDRGLSDPPFPAEEWLAAMWFGVPIGPGWGLLGFRKDVGALTEGAAYLFVAPDGSVLLNPHCTVSIAQNAELSLIAAATAGEAEGAFPPGIYSLLIRATVFF